VAPELVPSGKNQKRIVGHRQLKSLPENSLSGMDGNSFGLKFILTSPYKRKIAKVTGHGISTPLVSLTISLNSPQLYCKYPYFLCY